MDTDRTVNTLRDVVLRRRSRLPMPAGVDVDELLEQAAEVIETLKRDIEHLENFDAHCDGCDC